MIFGAGAEAPATTTRTPEGAGVAGEATPGAATPPGTCGEGGVAPSSADPEVMPAAFLAALLSNAAFKRLVEDDICDIKLKRCCMLRIDGYHQFKITKDLFTYDVIHHFSSSLSATILSKYTHHY
jgi:hypothetical protein